MLCSHSDTWKHYTLRTFFFHKMIQNVTMPNNRTQKKTTRLTNTKVNPESFLWTDEHMKLLHCMDLCQSNRDVMNTLKSQCSAEGLLKGKVFHDSLCWSEFFTHKHQSFKTISIHHIFKCKLGVFCRFFSAMIEF